MSRSLAVLVLLWCVVPAFGATATGTIKVTSVVDQNTIGFLQLTGAQDRYIVGSVSSADTFSFDASSLSGVNFLDANAPASHPNLAGLISPGIELLASNSNAAIVGGAPVQTSPGSTPQSGGSVSIPGAEYETAIWSVGALQVISPSWVNHDGSLPTTSIVWDPVGQILYLTANPAAVILNHPGSQTVSFSFVGTIPSGVPDMVISKSHTGNFSQGQQGATYTITVGNSGGVPSVGTVTVVDTLPSGLTATGMSGAGWTCTLGTLTCTRLDALMNGSNYPAITLTVTVSTTAGSSVMNQATVSGGGESNTNNDSASDQTTINPIANVSAQVVVTQNGFVRNRASGLWVATMTVKNSGATTINSPIQVVFTNLTPGVTMTNNTGTRNGNPYLTVLSSGSLAPDASVTATILFSNPASTFITFTPETDQGTF